MDETYLFSMREHLSQLQIDLEGLSCIIGQRNLNCYEYRAAERTLQILIEACIGIALFPVFRKASYGLLASFISAFCFRKKANKK